MRCMLLELSALQSQGGFQCRHNGQVCNYWPALGVFITDEPEAELATLLRGCRICNVSLDQLSNTDEIHTGNHVVSIFFCMNLIHILQKEASQRRSAHAAEWCCAFKKKIVFPTHVTNLKAKAFLQDTCAVQESNLNLETHHSSGTACFHLTGCIYGKLHINVCKYLIFV